MTELLRFTQDFRRSIKMAKEVDERLKKIIEDKKSKTAQQKVSGSTSFSKLGNQQKAFRNKKGGGLFDK